MFKLALLAMTGVLVLCMVAGCFEAKFEASLSLPPPVQITTITPDTGPDSGGTQVTINGSGFRTSSLLDVTFGGVSTANFSVVDDVTLTCVTPAAAAPGAVDVAVVGLFSHITAFGGFTYTPTPVGPPMPLPPPQPAPGVPPGASGDFCRVIVIDCSATMNAAGKSGPIEDINGHILYAPSCLDVAKVTAGQLLRSLVPPLHNRRCSFAVITFGALGLTYFPAPLEATPGSVDAALTSVDALQTGAGMGDVVGAMQIACTKYGAVPDDIVLITANAFGYPVLGAHGTDLLRNFPMWYAPLNAAGCTLQCVSIKSDNNAAQFLAALASQNGGLYIAK